MHLTIQIKKNNHEGKFYLGRIVRLIFLHNLGIVNTQVLKYTFLTSWLTCVANLASVANEIKMSSVVGLWWKKFSKDAMSCLGTGFGRAQSQAMTQSVNVGIYRESRHIEGKLEDDGSRFRSYAFKLRQPFMYLLRLHLTQERQV